MANLGIKIKVDYSSIDDLAKKINQLTKDKLEIDLKLNTSNATEKLKTFKSKYDELKTYMKDGLDIKFDSNGSFDKAFQNMKSNADKVSNSISDVQKQADEMNKKFKGSDGSLSTMARTVKTLANGTKQTTDSMTRNISSYQKSVETVTNNEQKSVKTITDKKAALKEIAGVMNEIGTLNTKSLSADDRSGAAIKDRVATLKSQLSSLQSHYKTVFNNEDSSNSNIVKQTSALNAYNQEIKRASIEKQKQAQFDKETESTIKQIVQLENERYRLLKQSDSVGDNEASVLRKQADAIKEKSSELSRQQGLAERMNSTQAQSLSNLKKENEVAREYSSTLSRAKDVDSARVKAQANAYREIKSQMQDVYAIQEKIAQLSALDKNGTISGKEETKLQSLRQELTVREDLMIATINQSALENKLSSTQQDSLSALQKEKSYKLDSARATAEINAEARKTDQLYDEIASSMKKVHSLSNELADAGSSESRVIRDIISLEEKRQGTIRETLALQGRVNNARDDELNTMKRQNDELQEENSRRSRASRVDNIGDNGILGNFLNPMSLANDVRQAAMTIYDSVAPLDKAMVDIAKVAEEPQAELDAFADTIYSTASTVGKSAEEYAVSVERWLTAGKTLSESVELSKTSVMGAFVGNVGESEMVDYMSVPLNAYKKNALEANDIINAMNEVANKNAIEMDDMGSAYKRAASTSAQAGTSFAQLTGLITAGQEATRVGGETMGTAIKAMDVNLGKIGSGITKGDVDKSEFLKNIGVDVKDANGELKSTYQVLGDLNKVWKNLNTNQKSTAGFYLAGKQFQNVFSGIMGNWDVVLKATNEAQGQVDLIDKKSGSAFQEFEKQQDSIQFKAANLKNSWTELLNTISGGKGGITAVMASITDGLQLANKLAKNDALRTIAISAAKIIGLMTATTVVSKFFSIITEGSMGAVSKMTGLTSIFGKTSKVASASTGAMATGFSASAQGLGGLIGLGTKFIPVVGGIILALDLLNNVIPVWDTLGGIVDKVKGKIFEGTEEVKRYRKEQEKLTKSISSNKIITGDLANSNKLFKTYQDLIGEKEKLYQESGDGSLLSFNEEEFNSLKRNVNETIDVLGLPKDLKITFNDFNDIKQKLQQIEVAKNALTTNEAIKLTKDLGEKAKPVDTKKVYSQYERTTLNDPKGVANQIKMLTDDKYILQFHPTFNKEDLAQFKEDAKKQVAELQRTTTYRDGFYSSKNMLAAEKATNAEIKDMMETRRRLLEPGNLASLAQGFQNVGAEEQKNTIALVASGIPSVKKQGESYRGLADRVREYNELKAQGRDKEASNLTVSNDQLGVLQKMSSEYSGLNTNIQTWANAGLLERITGSVGSGAEDSNKKIGDLEGSIRQLGQIAGINVDALIAASQSGGAKFVQMMTEYGDMGATILGVTSSLRAEAEISGTTWQSMAKKVQEELDKLPQEKVTKYNLKTEDGLANYKVIDDVLNLPASIITKFELRGDDGVVNVGKTVEMLEKIPPEVVSKFSLDTDGNGNVSAQEIIDKYNSLDKDGRAKLTLAIETQGKEGLEEVDKKVKEATKDDKKVDVKIKTTADLKSIEEAQDRASKIIKGFGDMEAVAKFKVDNKDVFEKAESADKSVQDFNGKSAEARFDAKNQEVLRKKLEAEGFLVTFDSATGTATLTADPSKFHGKTAEVEASLAIARVGTSYLNGNKDDFQTKMNAVDAELSKNKETTVNIFGWADGLVNWFKNLVSGSSKSVNVSVGGTKKDSSVGIQTGSSFSASIGSQIGTSQSSSIDSATSKYSKDNEKPATVNEDVWRYWSKELFEGLPLQNSLDKLKDSVDAAGEDQDKLISLYKQQITQYDKQIAYQRGLGGSYQDEMNSVLGQLRGKGFNSNGNKITNLGHAKSLSGDNASEAETLLNKWKELYSSINETQKTINDLNASKRQAQEQIKDADTARELKKIEGILKRTEAILKSVENNTSIQNVKEGFLGSGDYELNLNIKEQGLNSSINNVNSLIDEYNKLSTTSIAYAENAEQVQSTLENLKSTILSNADSIIQYRESLNSIRIDRLVSDYEAYSQVINDSISRIGNSIDDLKEGLVSGTTLSDLYSSQFGTLDLTRKTKLEQEHENRLNLEAELDAALDGFAKKNVERTQSVSNQILTIEKDKYQNLLRLAQDYTNGKPLTISTATVDNIGIGITSSTNKDKTQYNSWADNLKKITKSYNDAYTQMVAKYDDAIKKAKTGSEKDLLTNQMIIDQLKLQEDMYKKMIGTNNQMITQSKVELENLTLTTEQRQRLEDAIKEYQQANIDAQKSIKESISARYEFEFDLIDKAMDKAAKYSENLNYLLNVSELINMSSSSKQSLYEAIFAGKINEYSKAKKNLESLVSEQKKFEEGSYEWGLLQTKVDDVRGSLHDLTADALNANKDLLENNLSSVQEKLEKGLLNGKTLEDWKEYQDSWTTGIAKEIELEAIRKRMVGLEDDVLNKRLEALDRQEAVSKKDIEYLDKQSKILELQSKLNNISKERNVQTLVRGDNGKWAWQYVADQSEYDSTKKELDDAKKELEEFKSSQRAEYVEGLGGIIDEAKDGKYSSPEELTNALSDLNSVYGNILTDIPNLNFGSIDDIVSAYQNYLTANKLIAGDAIGTGTALTQQTIDNIGLKFESSFMNIADKLGEIIGTELRNALGMLNGKQVGANGNYVIQNQELQFPNVTDANGIEEVFKNLPSVTEQLTLKK